MSNLPTCPHIHGSKLRRKCKANPESEDLSLALTKYEKWRSLSLKIEDRGVNEIHELVRLLNEYKDSVEPIFDARANSAQEVLQPSIIEEFFEFLFCRVDESVGCHIPVKGSAKGFIDLVFNPTDVKNAMAVPEFTVRRKDQDYVLGARLNMKFVNPSTNKSSGDTEIVVPVVAIECKRYLERNMLDECSGTSEKIKGATPYCLFIVVAEYLKMDDGFPELTKIDEVFVLRKQRNSERLEAGFTPNPIDARLVVEIYEMVIKHLGKIWWNPQSAVETGRLFNF